MLILFVCSRISTLRRHPCVSFRIRDNSIPEKVEIKQLDGQEINVRKPLLK